MQREAVTIPAMLLAVLSASPDHGCGEAAEGEAALSSLADCYHRLFTIYCGGAGFGQSSVFG
jgi:hypothetical protein